MRDEKDELVPTQSMQIPIPLKKELDNIKIIERESYPSVIRRLVDEYYKHNGVKISQKNKRK